MVRNAAVMNCMLRHSRRKAPQHLGGLRPLQRQQRAVAQFLDLDLVGQMLPQMRDVVILAAGIDDQHQVIAGVGHHEIVEDAALVVGELGVALRPGVRPWMSPGTSVSSAAAALFPPFAAQADLAHMRDVEQALRLSACADARRGCRWDTAPASRSRRTAPYGRRARTCRGCRGVSDRGPVGSLITPVLRQVDRHRALRRDGAPSVFGPERFAGGAIAPIRLTSSVRQRTRTLPRRMPSFQSAAMPRGPFA